VNRGADLSPRPVVVTVSAVLRAGKSLAVALSDRSAPALHDGNSLEPHVSSSRMQPSASVAEIQVAGLPSCGTSQSLTM
jgi:hypothetical protein